MPRDADKVEELTIGEPRMAIYHASLRALSRSKGESAVAAAAYRTGVALPDNRLGLTQDYSRRSGVEFVSLLLPPGSPAWAKHAATLWNAVEAAETRVNSRVARELIIGLPHELDEAARRNLAAEMARVLVDRYRVPVQLAIHAPDRGGDERNHHAHLLFAGRVLGPDGFGAKVRVLDEPTTGPDEIRWLRAKVAELTNSALSTAGIAQVVDHRSLAVQADEAERKGDFEKAAQLTREPTVHLGRAATGAARRGQPQPNDLANAAIRQEHGKALAAYLAETRTYRQRLLAAAHAKRAARQAGPRTSPTPRVVPGVHPTPPGRGRRGGRSYEEGLLEVVRSGGRMASAVIEAAGQRERLADRLASVHSPEALVLRRHAEEAEKALGAAQAEVDRRRARLKEAVRLRETTQRAWDAGLGPRPTVWRPAKRQAWEQERKRLWGRLRKAIAREQDAQEDLGPVARAALRSKVAEARRKLAEAQEAMRRRLDRPLEPETVRGPPLPAITHPRRSTPRLG